MTSISHAQEVRDGGHRFVFSDIHVALDYARFFDDLSAPGLAGVV